MFCSSTQAAMERWETCPTFRLMRWSRMETMIRWILMNKLGQWKWSVATVGLHMILQRHSTLSTGMLLISAWEELCGKYIRIAMLHWYMMHFNHRCITNTLIGGPLTFLPSPLSYTKLSLRPVLRSLWPQLLIPSLLHVVQLLYLRQALQTHLLVVLAAQRALWVCCQCLTALVTIHARRANRPKWHHVQVEQSSMKVFKHAIGRGLQLVPALKTQSKTVLQGLLPQKLLVHPRYRRKYAIQSQLWQWTLGIMRAGLLEDGVTWFSLPQSMLLHLVTHIWPLHSLESPGKAISSHMMATKALYQCMNNSIASRREPQNSRLSLLLGAGLFPKRSLSLLALPKRSERSLPSPLWGSSKPMILVCLVPLSFCHECRFLNNTWSCSPLIRHVDGIIDCRLKVVSAPI